MSAFTIRDLMKPAKDLPMSSVIVAHCDQLGFLHVQDVDVGNGLVIINFASYKPIEAAEVHSLIGKDATNRTADTPESGSGI